MTEPAEFVTRLHADGQEQAGVGDQGRGQDQDHGRDRDQGWDQGWDQGRSQGWDQDREAAFHADQRRRRVRRLSVGAFAALALAGVTAWLVAAPEGPPESRLHAAELDEQAWPDAWPATTGLPLRGSPARTWATEKDELPLPPATAVGSIPKEKVSDGLRRAREFLVAANLDPEVLQGAWPAEAMELLDPQQPARAELTEHLREPGLPDADPTELFTRFDPARLTPARGGIRVRGQMAFEAGGAPGQLRIHADYTFVYAVRRVAPRPEPGPAPGTEEVARVVVRRQLVLLYAATDSPGVTAGKLIPAGYRRQLGNHDCGTVDGFVHPYFSREAAAAERPWPVVDPYDDSKDIPDGRPSCTVPSRT
ncbi:MULTISPECIES: hypothetical protein [unclassified Streptomyces]|uniref:hypothetical protein n=1 Tax=unclassified Streptomyces TaxID=2593676 RepID=UPI00202DBC49|nr:MULTISPECIES: hypothetical protein [unclassified Streptomyces]MCM1965999.1 hypothetical protein [Streptomyces sp. G1]MCX5126656.1 hypothetical protein [Streptomyces sp. NBC_00347]